MSNIHGGDSRFSRRHVGESNMQDVPLNAVIYNKKNSFLISETCREKLKTSVKILNVYQLCAPKAV